MSLTVAGCGWHEDTGEKILQGRSEEQCTKAQRLGGLAIFGEWQAAVWPGCFVGSGVRMEMKIRDVRRLGGPSTLTLGLSLSPRHQSLSIALTRTLVGPSHVPLVPESQSWGDAPFPRSSIEGHREGAAFLSFLAAGHRNLPAETVRSAVHSLGCLVSLCLVSGSVALVATSQSGPRSCMGAAMSLCSGHPLCHPVPVLTPRRVARDLLSPFC